MPWHCAVLLRPADRPGGDEALLAGAATAEAAEAEALRPAAAVAEKGDWLAGIGTACRWEDVDRSRREARQALYLGRARGGRVFPFSGLGVFRLLLGLPPEELARLSGEALRGLEGQLLATLEAYFWANGNISRTAERLFVHRHTVLYRLQRIQETLGVDLEDPAERLQLVVGALAQRTLRCLDAT